METIRYLAANSFLGRRDPRVLILVSALTIVVVAQIQDVRLMAIAALLALAYYLSAGIPFGEVRTNWLFVGVFVLLLAGVNGVIAGAGQYAGVAAELFTIPGIGVVVSTATVSYTVTMLLRFLAIAATGFPLSFAVRPGDLSVAFARLGMPSRFAYGIDLTFRFIPTLAANLRETIAAQRLRGYETGHTRNPARRISRLRPLVVPVTVSAFVDAEDVADALDLRGFGSQRRTWLRTLRLNGTDMALIGFCTAATVTATVASVTGHMPGLWVG
ncbi:energy-coupling factor transporter transmembrane component T family protein [Mycolicibacterium brisbanense]|uniref:ABC-type cobalt transport system permease compon ent CbiQ and related transporter-like protein n=1 Tax=Mycolicibacterium brisbanense TaxID=146020 RepID=A0A100VUB0_9MYCO|nr:energy-coupling factor transporter transmembrane component T [Mycolicibacterium brisbanense]MCV7157030.1 energy-coupling factor transporter transmembrane protein EcfT [Mycolicibacterium brisbanense]GAS86110.1 ABC-type cobalt transport system permease compon ent CbiQ and related transporter-like protein [Mycolicibacterium brisbanense]